VIRWDWYIQYVQLFRRDLSSASGQSLNGGGSIILMGFDFVWSFTRRSRLYQGSFLPSFDVTVVAVHIACNVQKCMVLQPRRPAS
jgi:hypothetical protein